WIAELNAALSMDPADRADDPELEQYGKALTELGLDVSRPSSELTCRGLMIIGTHRQLALEERPAESFPDPVTRLLSRSNVCALTGLDLYCMVHESRTDASLRGQLTRMILTTGGVLAPRDWRKVLLQT